MQFSKRRIFLILCLVVGIGATGFFLYSSVKTGDNGPGSNAPEKRTNKLVVWGVDDSSAFATIKKNFEAVYKDSSVNYVKIDEAVIQNQLVQALANNQAPDVIMIKNRTLARQKNFLSPVPVTKMSLPKFRGLFPTVAEQDFTDANRQIYALPLSIDTLALVYNKDFFDQARIIQPPKTWGELADLVPQLVKIGQGGQFDRSAIALGGSAKSITNAGDILALLFMQSGAKLASGELGIDGPGRQALNFYLQFSNPRSLAYTWNDLQSNDLQSFANLRSAMVLAYKRQIPFITNQNSFVNYGIASIPQLGADRVDYANNWGLAVTRTSRFSERAWDFVIYATTVQQNAQAYSKATKLPPALRELLASNYNDPELGVFAQQALTARSWNSPDDKQTRDIFSSMVSSYLTGQMDQDSALRRAQNMVSQIFRK